MIERRFEPSKAFGFGGKARAKLTKPAAEIVEALAKKGIIAGVPVSRLMPHDPAVRDLLIVAATETTTQEDADAFVATLKEVL